MDKDGEQGPPVQPDAVDDLVLAQAEKRTNSPDFAIAVSELIEKGDGATELGCRFRVGADSTAPKIDDAIPLRTGPWTIEESIFRPDQQNSHAMRSPTALVVIPLNAASAAPSVRQRIRVLGREMMILEFYRNCNELRDGPKRE